MTQYKLASAVESAGVRFSVDHWTFLDYVAGKLGLR